MKKKCILLVRVSTGKQDLNQQTEKVKEEALKDGYKDNQIIILENVESAVTLDEEERQGLNDLKRHIETEDIDCVYVYEISRISRKGKVLYSIRDYLVEKHIQLVVLNPYMKMLKDDGTLSETANIFFGIFSSMAENEGFIRKQRFARGRAKRKSEGYYTGGGVPYGYTVDSNKRFVVVDEEATIVKRVFEEYASGLSLRTIAKRLREEGYFLQLSENSMLTTLNQMIRREAYTGTEPGKEQIITRDLFDKAAAKCDEHRLYLPEKPEIFLLKGLVYDKNTGRKLSCNKWAKRYYSTHDKVCSCNKDSLDPFVWILLVREHSYRFFYDRLQIVEKAKIDIEQANRIIETCVQNIIKEKEILDRIYTSYIEMNITKERSDKLSLKHHKIIFDENEKIKIQKEKVVKLQLLIDSPNEKIEYDKLSFNEKRELCLQSINRVELSRGDQQYKLIVDIKFNWWDEFELIVDTYNRKVKLETKKPRKTLGY